MMNVNQECTMNAHCACEMAPERHESAHVKLCERVVPAAIVCFECVEEIDVSTLAELQ